jgi:hypothetical protein
MAVDSFNVLAAKRRRRLRQLRKGVNQEVHGDRLKPVRIELRTAPPRRQIVTSTDPRFAARALNQQIRRLADLLAGAAEHQYAFSCECGCGETVSLTASQYDREDCLAAGHRKPQST